jgi:hypothetical protein
MKGRPSEEGDAHSGLWAESLLVGFCRCRLAFKGINIVFVI